MEAAVWHANFILILLFCFALTGGQNMSDKCELEQIHNCIEQKFLCGGIASALRRAALRDADETQRIFCSVDIPECTSGLTHPDCPEEIVVGGALITEGFKALCENQGFLLKALLNAHECWDILGLTSCIEGLLLTTESYDVSEQTDRDLKLLKNESNKCATRFKIDSSVCSQVDGSAMEKLIHTVIGRIVPEYNAAPQACSSAAALMSFLLALVFTI
ncbi:hypothetical protein MRX96_008669 [Rhipicephalus microplus]|uniref:uncharacterized protein LOC119178436 n=1 Tax=Rhipicephalus microplus TaxID=6941 RepID=UPI003F6BBA16